MEVFLRSLRGISRLLLAGVGVCALSLFAPAARADSIVDFYCSISTCGSGTVSSPSSGVFTGSGITVFENAGSGFTPSTDSFTLAFNTATGAISISDNGPGMENLSGNITSFVSSNGLATGNLTLYADWTTLPADIQAYFNSTTGNDSGALTFQLSSGSVTSVDVTITSAPEPSVPILASAGLLGLGLLLKRKGTTLAALRS